MLCYLEIELPSRLVGCKTRFYLFISLLSRLGYTTLHLAAVHNSVECLRLLLSSFGPEDSRLEVCDHKGRTPVMLAASKGHSHIVKLLVQVRRFL